MTNLAYKQECISNTQDNVSYIDFAAHAARREEKRRRKALCAQHCYGLVLLVLCLTAVLISIAASFTDLTAILLLAPLGIYLLVTKNVILYQR